MHISLEKAGFLSAFVLSEVWAARPDLQDGPAGPVRTLREVKARGGVVGYSKWRRGMRSLG